MDYFLSRRKWFFGILGLIYVLDVFDTWIKGTAHLVAQGIEYDLRTLAGVVLCAVAARVESRRFHWVVAVGWLAYECGGFFASTTSGIDIRPEWQAKLPLSPQ
jgi:hypothetical protein